MRDTEYKSQQTDEVTFIKRNLLKQPFLLRPLIFEPSQNLLYGLRTLDKSSS